MRAVRAGPDLCPISYLSTARLGLVDSHFHDSFNPWPKRLFRQRAVVSNMSPSGLADPKGSKKTGGGKGVEKTEPKGREGESFLCRGIRIEAPGRVGAFGQGRCEIGYGQGNALAGPRGFSNESSE